MVDTKRKMNDAEWISNHWILLFNILIGYCGMKDMGKKRDEERRRAKGILPYKEQRISQDYLFTVAIHPREIFQARAT
jgi:hypothetical protein